MRSQNIIIFKGHGKYHVSDKVDIRIIKNKLHKENINVADIINYLIEINTNLQNIPHNGELECYYLDEDGEPVFLQKTDSMNVFSKHDTLFIKFVKYYSIRKIPTPHNVNFCDRDLPTPSPTETFNQFKSRIVPVFTVIFGLLGLLFSETLGSYMLIIGAISIPFIIRKITKTIIVPAICFVIIAIINYFLTGISPILAGAFGGVLFSLFFGYYFSRPLFNYQNDYQENIVKQLWFIALVLLLINIIVVIPFEFDNKNIDETSPLPKQSLVLTPPIKKWEFKGVNGDVFDTISCTDGITYIAMASSIKSWDDSNKIYAIDATSGLKKWEFVLDGGGKGSMNVKPAVANGLVYFGGQGDDKLYALDAETGQKVWEFNGMGSMYTSNPAVVDGVVYANGRNGLYALDAYSGGRKWHFPIRTQQNSPVIVDDILYIGSSINFLYAIDAKTGTEIWNIPGASRVFSYPLISNGTLYIDTSSNHIIKAFDAKTGSLKLEIMMEEKIAHMVGALALSNDILYVTIWEGLNGNGKLYALDALTGSEKWSFDTGAIGIKTPVVGNGIVYVCGCKNRMIYALDATTGVVKWHYQCDNSISTSPIIADGVLYVGVQDKLYAFSIQ